MSIGSNIAQIRKDTGLSQESFGEALGVSRQSISKWESDINLPEVEKLILISRLYGVSVDKILGIEEGDISESTELTDSQIKMVEAITEKYINALPSPQNAPSAPSKSVKKSTSRVLRIIAAACAVALIIWCANIADDISALKNNNTALQYQIDNFNNNISSQFGGITDSIEEMLKSQNSFVSDCGYEITGCNLAANTIDITVFAIPRTYEENMTVDFLVDNNGVTESFSATCDDTHKFTCTLTTELTNSITIYAVLGGKEKSDNQLVGELMYELMNTLFCDAAMDMGVVSIWNAAVKSKTTETVTLNSVYDRSISYLGSSVTIKELAFAVFVNGEQKGQYTAVTQTDGTLTADIPLGSYGIKEGDSIVFATILLDNFGRKYTAEAIPGFTVRNGVYELTDDYSDAKYDEITVETGVETLN